MPWVILLLSAVLEAVWATALGFSDGFTRLMPSLVFVVAATLSMLGLGKASQTIPIGTAYAVWTGTGATLTVLIAVFLGTETITWIKGVFILGIIAAVIGLKLVSTKSSDDVGSPDYRRDMELECTHNEDRKRYEVRADGVRVGLLTYWIQDGVISINHTETEDEYQGRGIAGVLTQFALDDIREKGLLVKPLCPYTSSWMRAHPEYDDLRYRKG